MDVNIREGDRERIQQFEGTVIARKGSGISETFTVRRVSYGVGVERVFPLHSPNVKAVQVVRQGRVRRAKLYYLRNRVARPPRSRSSSSKKATYENLEKGHLLSLFCYQFYAAREGSEMAWKTAWRSPGR